MPEILVHSFKKVKIVQLLKHTAKLQMKATLMKLFWVTGLCQAVKVDSGGHQANRKMSRILLKR